MPLWRLFMRITNYEIAIFVQRYSEIELVRNIKMRIHKPTRADIIKNYL